MTKKKPKPRGYWQSLETTIAEARRIMEEQEWDVLPSDRELRKHGHNSINYAISKYHGGMQEFRTTLGQTNTRKTKGYWQKKENVLEEARKTMKEQEWAALPSQRELKKNGYSSLSNAIECHGGIQQFRTTLGQTNNKKPQGYWKKENNALAESARAMEEQGWATLPSTEQLQKNGYSALKNAIIKYHGGLQKFREKLGQTNYQKLPGYWQKLENVLVEAQQAMQQHGWATLPAEDVLCKYGHSPLSNAIRRYCGGIQTFRTKLGQQNSRKPNGYWQKLENALAEAFEIMKKHNWNELPSDKELRKHGYASLEHAITRHHCGIHNFRKLLAEHQTGKTQKQQLEELLDEYIAA